MLDCVDLLKQLVSIPSVNPMGRDVSGPEFYEARLADYLELVYQKLGVPWVRQTVAPQRDNILARFDGDLPLHEGGELIVLEAHLDTVPVDGMTISPWEPVVRNGRLYGRGSCDVKGGLSAMLTAFSRLIDKRPNGRPTVIMASTINEEYGFSGAKKLCELWDGPDAWIPRRPDAIVVAEPTALNIVIAHKGTMRWRCHTAGRASHSSQPDRGDNAIYKMAKLISALQRFHDEVLPTLATHPLCGRPSLSVGVIQGGISVNTVPDQCTIEIDRRIMPGEDPSAALAHLLAYLDSQELGFKPVHDSSFVGSGGLSERNNGQLAGALAAAAGRAGVKPEMIGVPFGTNGSIFSAAAIPVVVFGPGDIAQAHTADEWIALDQLHAAAEIYYQFASTGLSSASS
jgi:acetylornithine deacetylase/succinyl-diaminopimelate desuccinylase-like protein